MMNYWSQLKPRERLWLGAAGVVIVAMSLYLLLLEPFLTKAEDMEQRVARQQKEVNWLSEAAVEVAQLKRQSAQSSSAGRRGQSLLVIVDQSAKRNDLADSMKRVEPDGTSRVRVWLERAPFDEISKWLVELERQYQLQIESAVFDKTESQGRVNARLVFLGGEA